MKYSLAVGAAPLLALVALAAEVAGRPEPAEPERATLRAVPAHAHEKLRRKYLRVVLDLEGGAKKEGILRSYRAGEGDAEGMFLISTDKENPYYQEPVGDGRVLRVEIKGPAKEEEKPGLRLIKAIFKERGEAMRRIFTEIREAREKGRLAELIEAHGKRLKSAAGPREAREEFAYLLLGHMNAKGKLDRASFKEALERIEKLVPEVKNPMARRALRMQISHIRRKMGGKPERPSWRRRGPGEGPGRRGPGGRRMPD